MINANQLPRGWKLAQLKDFVDHYKGGAPLKPSDFVDEGFPIIPKKAIGPGGRLALTETDVTFCKVEFAENHTSSIVDNRYMITTLRDLVPTGPSIGYIVRSDSTQQYLLAQGVYGFILRDDLYSEFLIHLSNTDAYRRIMQRIMVGSTQVHIRTGEFFEIEIPLPPLPEQRKIAAILSTWDEAIALVESLIAALKARKQGLMQRLLTGDVRFPGFDGAWDEVRLGDVVSIRSGKSPSQFALSDIGMYPFIKVDDLNIDRKYQSKSRNYTNDIDESIPSNSVIFPKRGAAISGNKVRLASVSLYMDSNMMALIPDSNKVYPEYLFYALLNERLHRIADTSTIPQINNKHIEPYKIQLPTLREQHRIGDILEQGDYQIDLGHSYANQLREQKKGLMQRLLTGAVRVGV